MSAIEHRHLRSALEYAVLIAAEGQKRRPPLAFPKDLKPFLGQRRIAGTSLGRIRRAVEADTAFRKAIAAGAVPELVDEVGRLWLDGRSGWEAEAATLIATNMDETATTDLRRDLKRAEKRRHAAEQATARVLVDVLRLEEALVEQAAALDGVRSDLATSDTALAAVRLQLTESRNETRHARDREASARARAEASVAQPVGSREMVEPGDEHSAVADIDGLSRSAVISAEQRLAEIVDVSREFAERIESLLSEHGPPEPPRETGGSRRRGLPLPGGVISTSAAAASHLVSQGAPILVDGYNVAKLAWPDRSLEQQREALISRCENFARRLGASVTVVFDGDSIPGAHAPVRRTIRVVYSPAGTTADDVIRAEVEHLDEDRPVVVVTNDREIVADVKAVGANVVASNAFIAVL